MHFFMYTDTFIVKLGSQECGTGLTVTVACHLDIWQNGERLGWLTHEFCQLCSHKQVLKAKQPPVRTRTGLLITE